MKGGYKSTIKLSINIIRLNISMDFEVNLTKYKRDSIITYRIPYFVKLSFSINGELQP